MCLFCLKTWEKVWKIELGPSVDLRLPNEFDLSSRLEYILYKGYGKELDCGLWNLSFELNKEIGAFVLSLKCNDAFNQSKNISHIASSEYVQNVIQNRLGRTVLVSVGYLFGKGSSEKQRNSNKFVRNVSFFLTYVNFCGIIKLCVFSQKENKKVVKNNES